MSEELLVRHCSPTLAGMKTGNMFTCNFEDEHHMRESICQMNRMFSKKGVRVLPLRKRENRALLYVFRPKRLQKDLEHHVASRLLQERGYDCKTPHRCIACLIKRLSQCEDFPHEIGLFLGYPPEDVDGFIENKCCKCVGCWKVYGNEDAARKLFAKYKKCTAVYCDQWAKGRSIERLTLAG